MFSGSYLKSSDLQPGERRLLTIREVKVEEVGEGAEMQEKPVVYFNEEKMGMVINKTNSMNLANVFGENIEGWPGRQIDLLVHQVMFGGRMVDGLLCQPRISQQPAAAPAQWAPPENAPHNMAAPAPQPQLTPEQIIAEYEAQKKTSPG